MPSPFPGMDPWLEGDLWSSVHYELCSAIARQLVPRLVPKYFAIPARRNVCEGPGEIDIAPGHATIPDVGVYPTRTPSEPASTAVLSVTPRTLTAETVVAPRVPHYFVEVRDTAERSLVTMIEVLSPANKRSPGYEQYLAKRSRILKSKVHLVEIDLLRTGRRIPTRQSLPDTPYFVFLNRAGRRRRTTTDVWSIALSSPLPTIPIPLRSPDPDVPLELQAALNAVYDSLAFQYIVDYRTSPDVELNESEQHLVSEKLRAIGVRA